MFESFQQLKSYRTICVWILSTIENLSNKRCLSHLNSGEPIEQTMCESSQQWKTYRTSDVWTRSTVKNLSNKRCVSHLNNGKPIEQTMFEASQQWKTYRTSDVWTAQQRKTYRTNDVWVISTAENLSNRMCLNSPNTSILLSSYICQLIPIDRISRIFPLKDI